MFCSYMRNSAIHSCIHRGEFLVHRLENGSRQVYARPTVVLDHIRYSKRTVTRVLWLRGFNFTIKTLVSDAHLTRTNCNTNYATN